MEKDLREGVARDIKKLWREYTDRLRAEDLEIWRSLVDERASIAESLTVTMAKIGGLKLKAQWEAADEQATGAVETAEGDSTLALRASKERGQVGGWVGGWGVDGWGGG
jgi:hypothetical protein